MTFLSKPITYKGKHYPSRRALAKAYGLTCEVLRYRLLRGIALEDVRKFMRYKPVMYQGKAYGSVRALAEACGLSVGGVQYRLRQGIPLDKSKEAGCSKEIEIDGVRYQSYKEAAEALGITAAALSHRIIRARMPRKKRLPGTQHWRACEYEGKLYRSVNALAKALGLSNSKAKDLIDIAGKWLD